MKTWFAWAPLAALAVLALAPAARAGCDISPDGKAINVVADNASSEEKNCAVKCRVDTKIGVVQVSCGGNVPPLAKGHSLCNFDKPEPWYKKVVSAEDSCKVSANAPPPQPKPAAANAFSCKVAADGKSVEAMIVNPYKSDTFCQVDCQISTTKAGTTFSVSCGKTIAPGGGEAVVCRHAYDGRLVKMLSGKGNCTNPEPSPAKADKDDDDVDVDKLSKGLLPKPPAAKPDDVDMEELAKDPEKMRDYMRKQLPPEARKMFDEMNKR